MILVDFALRALSAGKLTVFVFHKVPAQPNPLVADDLDLQSFRTVLDFAQEHFCLMPLDEAAVRLEQGRLPKRAAAITLDDGYSDWVSGVVPELMRRQLPATLFITSGQIDGLPMWHERIAQAISALRERASPGIRLVSAPSLGMIGLATLAECQQAIRRLEQHFKYQPLDRRETLLCELESAAGVSPQTLPRLGAAEIRDFHNKGFTIGAHTVNHPILTQCDEHDARNEMGACREALSAITGAPVTGFAYPNGQPGVDFTEAHVRMARAVGYTHAVTTHRGVAAAGTSPFQLPRFTPWGPSYLHRAVQVARNLRTAPHLLAEVAS